MSALFTLPKQVPLSGGAILPGAKLAFTQTGTSTPQNTYQDNARVTPHANPVIADANGVFPAIYLDPTLPDYRVALSTSADVLIYQQDGIPSNQNTQQSLRLESTSPSLFWYDTDGTANQRKFRTIVTGNKWELQASNDAENTFTTFIAIEGGVLQRLTINSLALVDDGVNEYAIAYNIANTFTGTLTGFASPPTGTLYYSKIGNIVSIFIPNAGSGFSGTSNSTSMTITGMPAVLWPTRTQICAFPAVGDNSVNMGLVHALDVQIDTSGVMTFRIDGSTTGFTNTGVKSTSSGGTITYLTN